MAATQDKKEKFLELRANGESFAAIAKALGISKTTAVQWSKDMTAELANMRAIAAEDLQKRYKLGKEHNLRMWRELLDMAEAELKSRGFNDIKTGELISLIENFADKLSDANNGIELKDNPRQVANPYGILGGDDKMTAYDTWTA